MSTSKGRDIDQQVTISLREAYTGTTYRVVVNGVLKNVKIPAGAMSGTKIRIAGEGGFAPEGGTKGDLYLVIDVIGDSIFTREQHDLRRDFQIGLITATHGGVIDIPTLIDSVQLKIPAGTMNGTVFRLIGKGMPHMKKDTFGDLYVRILIDPSELWRSL